MEKSEEETQDSKLPTNSNVAFFDKETGQHNCLACKWFNTRICTYPVTPDEAMEDATITAITLCEYFALNYVLFEDVADEPVEIDDGENGILAEIYDLERDYSRIFWKISYIVKKNGVEEVRKVLEQEKDFEGMLGIIKLFE